MYVSLCHSHTRTQMHAPELKLTALAFIQYLQPSCGQNCYSYRSKSTQPLQFTT